MSMPTPTAAAAKGTRSSTTAPDFYDRLRLSAHHDEEDATGTSTGVSVSQIRHADSSGLVRIFATGGGSGSGGSDVFNDFTSTGFNTSAHTDTMTYRLAEIKIFLPFTASSASAAAAEPQQQAAYDDAFSALLAVQHFNNQHHFFNSTSGSFASDSATTTRSSADIFSHSDPCDARMTATLVDTSSSPIEATVRLNRLLQEEEEENEEEEGAEEGQEEGETERGRLLLSSPRPTAIIGGGRDADASTEPLAVLSGVRSIPHLSHTATSAHLDLKDQYPLFGRTVSSGSGGAAVALSFWADVVRSTHVAVLFVTDSVGSALEKAFTDRAAEYSTASTTTRSGSSNSTKNINIETLLSISVHPDETAETVQAAMVRLERSGIRHVYAICHGAQLPVWAEAAAGAGLMPEEDGTNSSRDRDGGMVWMFPLLDLASFVGGGAVATPPAVSTFLAGSAVVTMEGAIPIPTPISLGGDDEEGIPDQRRRYVTDDPSHPAYSRFAQGWEAARRDGRFVSYALGKVAEASAAGGVAAEKVEEGGSSQRLTFSDEPGALNSFMYDAVVSLGISICRANVAAMDADVVDDDDDDDNERQRQQLGLASGEEIYDSFRTLDVQGASGRIKIHEETGSRDYETVNFVIWNAQRGRRGVHNEGNKVAVSFVPTHRYEGVSGQWLAIENSTFLYQDGSDIPPASIPRLSVDNHFISTGARAAGYALMSIIVASVLISWTWLFVHRSERAVKASGPTFLFALSLGALILSLSIPPMGMDEMTASSNDGLDASCVAFPWLFVVGASLLIGALFAKILALYRAFLRPDQTLLVCTWRHCLGACGAMLVCNVSILLAWTLTAPPEWSRSATDSRDRFDRTIESYGFCESEKGSIFVTVLGVVNAAIIVIANVMSFRTRNIQTEFQESMSVAISMAFFLQILCTGVPLLIVVQDDPQGRFLVQAGIIFMTALPVLLLVYVPKVKAVKALGRGDS